MSARLTTKQLDALAIAIGSMQGALSPLAADLASLLPVLTSLRECTQCGCSDLGYDFRLGSSMCPHCEAELAAEANAKYDSERDVDDWHQVASSGGYL